MVCYGALFILLQGFRAAASIAPAATESPGHDSLPTKSPSEDAMARVAKTDRKSGRAAKKGGARPAVRRQAVAEAEIYRSLFDSVTAGLYQSTPAGRFLQINPALARMLGYDSPEQLLAEVRDIGSQIYVDPELRAKLLRRLEREGSIDEVVLQCRRRDGSMIWTQRSVRAMRDGSGRMVSIIGSLIDVTELVEARERLVRAENDYREIFENAFEGIYRSTADGEMLRANPALVRLNGFEREEELLEAVADIGAEWYVDPKRRETFRTLLDDYGRITNFESEVHRFKTRERIFISENARAVRDSFGRLLYYEGTVLDITERRRAETALKKAMSDAQASSRAKSEFLANMSHELRTPLNAVIGFSEIMTKELFGKLGNPRYLEYQTDILASARYLLQLIEDILDISKAEAGKIELDESTVEIADAVIATTRMLQERARSADITLASELPSNLPQLCADERRFRQILLNLLSNAVKFTPAGGKVTVGAERRADGGITILVADSGVGIGAADQERIFEPFVQLDRARRGQEGTGLGLPLCRKLVELHGGTLTLKSELGQGTVVEIHFPPERAIKPKRTSSAS
ncbi:MAG: PAS domain-containing sensor histidine kinase [Kiloniellales bacterium]